MIVEVHVDWRGETHFAGRLFAADQGQAVSFEYTSEWLASTDPFAIDPTSLPLRTGGFHAPSLFGAFQDCGPDRWGKVLIERAVRKRVLAKKAYRDIDYVLALDDETRLGALRFRISGTHDFLATGSGKLPPLIRLNDLLMITEAIHQEKESAKDLRFLLGAGSPLGGARPKSAVEMVDGNLGMAKFPKPDDVRDIGAGEGLALTLARLAGIQTVDHHLMLVNGRHVIVVKRFDRIGSERIPFVSAATMLGLPASDPGSYVQLADGIRLFGHNVTSDLKELWRRLVFSLLLSNHDDHMRNHGFLMREPGRWALSPAYDINPVPEIDRVHTAQTPISDDGDEASIAAALNVASRFGLRKEEAKAILKEILATVKTWRTVGRKMKLKAGILDAYETAFEHELIFEAEQLVK
ncbi:MAG: type II toxin-antitoxin system HipA family toxin [Verrucomicrobium sp.]